MMLCGPPMFPEYSTHGTSYSGWAAGGPAVALDKQGLADGFLGTPRVLSILSSRQSRGHSPHPWDAIGCCQCLCWGTRLPLRTVMEGLWSPLSDGYIWLMAEHGNGALNLPAPTYRLLGPLGRAVPSAPFPCSTRWPCPSLPSTWQLSTFPSAL